MSDNSYRKNFSEEDFKKFDNSGKEAVRAYLESQNYLVAYNPNQYLADLIVLEETEGGYFQKAALAEAGVRYSWKGDWPKKWSLRIEKRKDKYLEQGLPVWYCITNADQSVMVILKKPLTDYAIIKVTNRFCEDGQTEENYEIPVGEFEVIRLKSKKVTKTKSNDDKYAGLYDL